MIFRDESILLRLICFLGIPGIDSQENGIPPSGLGGGEISWAEDLKEEVELEDEEREEEEEERDGLRRDDGHLGLVKIESSFFLPLLLASAGSLLDIFGD